MNIFRFIPGYEHEIYDMGKEPMLVLLASFLITFMLVRLYTRLARSRGWGSGNVDGVHLHHVVPGVILLVVGGLLALAPQMEGIPEGVAGILFGAGAALTLDEFALIFRLEDVYWSKEGRASVDAAILAALAAGVMLVVSSPFGIEDELDFTMHRKITFALVVLNALFALVSILKGKLFMGIGAMLVPAFGLIGALRLATPRSPWAQFLYNPDRGRAGSRERRAAKRARAIDRYVNDPPRAVRFRVWLNEAVGGRPTTEPEQTG